MSPQERLADVTKGVLRDSGLSAEAVNEGFKNKELPYPWCWKFEECRATGRCMARINCGD